MRTIDNARATRTGEQQAGARAHSVGQVVESLERLFEIALDFALVQVGIGVERTQQLAAEHKEQQIERRHSPLRNKVTPSSTTN